MFYGSIWERENYSNLTPNGVGGQPGRIRTRDNSTLANITSFDKSSQKATSRYYFVVLVKQNFKTTNGFFGNRRICEDFSNVIESPNSAKALYAT